MVNGYKNMMQLALTDIQTEIQQQNCINKISGDCEVQISYTSDFTSAKILRDFSDRLCKKYGITSKWRTRIILIIDELNNNAIEHGSGDKDTNLFAIKLEIQQNKDLCIHISVTDAGTGKCLMNASDMQKLQEKQKSTDFGVHSSIRGRGLFLIISKLVDDLQFHDDKNGGLRVEVQKILPQNSQE